MLEHLHAGDDVERAGRLARERFRGDEPVVDRDARSRARAACATPSGFSARSMPVTCAPRAAIASVRMPPPQPTSSDALAREAAGDPSIQPRRSGLISCSGRNSLVRVPPAVRERRELRRARRDRRSAAVDGVGHGRARFSDAGLATARARERSRRRRALQRAAGDDALAVDPHVGHVLAARGVHEVRDGIVAGRERRAPERSTAIRSASLPGVERADATRRARARARRRASPCAATVARRAARPRRRR